MIRASTGLQDTRHPCKNFNASLHVPFSLNCIYSFNHFPLIDVNSLREVYKQHMPVKIAIFDGPMDKITRKLLGVFIWYCRVAGDKVNPTPSSLRLRNLGPPFFLTQMCPKVTKSGLEYSIFTVNEQNS